MYVYILLTITFVTVSTATDIDVCISYKESLSGTSRFTTQFHVSKDGTSRRCELPFMKKCKDR